MMSLQLHTPPAIEPVSRTEAKLHARIDGSDEDALVDALVRAAREHVEAVTRRQLIVATYKLRMNHLPSIIELPRPPLVQVSSVTYVDSAGDVQTAAAATYYDVDTNRLPPALRLKYGASWPSTRGYVDDVVVTHVNGYAALVTANADTNVLTITGRTVADEDIIRFSNSGGTLPAPLTVATDYHVRDQSGQTFKVATAAGGAELDLTTAGTGTHCVGEVPEALRSAIKLLFGLWFENREAAAEVRITEIPMAVDALIWPYRLWYEVPI